MQGEAWPRVFAASVWPSSNDAWAQRLKRHLLEAASRAAPDATLLLASQPCVISGADSGGKAISGVCKVRLRGKGEKRKKEKKEKKESRTQARFAVVVVVRHQHASAKEVTTIVARAGRCFFLDSGTGCGGCSGAGVSGGVGVGRGFTALRKNRG